MTALIYEVHVRAYCDSDGDGIGDFPGLTSKLDYLQALGVTAIWLLPFYPSPLRDDGYDIAEYTRVNPTYGTLDDFKAFVEAAHERGIRVITELVINHTSDQHPWFKRARRSPVGSAERDFYVWSDTTDRYREARIIFQDFEKSNWTWDDEAGAYFWHRFYSHQPDLNFDNEAVHDAVMEVMDFWFDLGVDGMRLDAVPYLYEREGTNCENLDETHEFLRKLRAHLDEKYEDKMLLGEANQWPEDTAEYFGDGDECHMNYHFPLMPRLFMAVRMEDRFPILDILEQTPEIPEGCQWALFLRNHDELTLEMVTDEERDYMYRAYASDEQARINLGIRRRLAPLLENNRRKIELLNGLLFSLPGTPVLYYGDEIGMGDNFYLGDRDAVRTPMQWSPDKNAGFSRANPQRLFLPVVIDPGYHYESVNVETQLSESSSLLWWTRRIIGLRRRHPVFGTGSFRFVDSDNPKVFAFLRESESERVLVVANLSRFTQATLLDLSEFNGFVPTEMFGGGRFPPIRESRYSLTLAPHTFMWLSLRGSERAEAAMAEENGGPPEVQAEDDPASWLTSSAARRCIGERLSEDIHRQPWRDHQPLGVREIEVEDALPIQLGSEGPSAAAMAIVRVRFSGSEFGVFALAVALATPEYFRSIAGDPDAVLATVKHTSHRTERLLYDASSDPAVAKGLLDLISSGGSSRGYGGVLAGRASEKLPDALPPSHELPEARPLSRDFLRGSSVAFGSRFVLKLVCRDRPANEAALEVLEHLTERCDVPFAPDAVGRLDYTTRSRRTFPVAVARVFVQHESSVRAEVADAARMYLDELFASSDAPFDGDAPSAPVRTLVDLASEEPPASLHPVLVRFADTMEHLGRRVAELHGALADDQGDERFTPEGFTSLKQRAMYQSMRNAVIPTLRMLGDAMASVDPGTRANAQLLIDNEDCVLGQMKRISEVRLDSVRIRCHGHLELEPILWTGRDYVFTDFEGDPAGRLAELRLKHSPYHDLAALVTDLARTSASVAEEQVEAGLVPPSSPLAGGIDGIAAHWAAWTSAALVRGYTARAEEIRPELLPATSEGRRVLFQAEGLERAMRNLRLALVRRPGEIRRAVGWVLLLIRCGDETASVLTGEGVVSKPEAPNAPAPPPV